MNGLNGGDAVVEKHATGSDQRDELAGARVVLVGLSHEAGDVGLVAVPEERITSGVDGNVGIVGHDDEQWIAI